MTDKRYGTIRVKKGVMSSLQLWLGHYPTCRYSLTIRIKFESNDKL